MFEFYSVVKSDYLGWWNLELLIDTSLQVLVEQSLKLFVLLVKQSSLFDQVLSVHKHLIVLCQRLVESTPDREFLNVKNCCVFFPKQLQPDLFLGSSLILGFSSLLLFGSSGHSIQLKLMSTDLFELFKCIDNMLRL